MTSKAPLMEVALRLTGRGFSPADVTGVVELQPTKIWRLGDSIQGTELRRQHDAWIFGLPQRETHDTEEFLQDLLDRLEPHKDRIAAAAKMFGLDREISFGIYVRGQTPACFFARNTIRRLADFEGSLDIDVILIA